MPVVINDFEVIGDQPAAPQQVSTAEEASPQTGHGATPHDVENILRREKERLARVQAH